MPTADQLVQAGLEHKNAGRLAEAEACYRQALAQDANSASALGNLGVALRLQGRAQEAAECFARLAALFPHMAQAHYSLGNALADLNRPAEAAAALERAVALNPGYAEAWVNLGRIHHDAGRYEEAIGANRRALDANPGLGIAHGNLANALEKAERIDEAAAVMRQALALNPADAAAHGYLGNLLKDMGEIDAALDCYRRALALEPANPLHLDNWLLGLTYAGAAPEHWFAEHRRYGQMVESVPAMQHENAPDAERRLRLGYVSGDFREHSVANFIWPVFRHHDRERFEVFCYYTGEREDRASELFRGLAARWCNVSAMDAQALAERIRADGVDILVDLASHSGHNRLPAFARKPAPVQATWLGYAATTGLARIDYRITDDYLDPPGDTERWHSERLMRLPGYSLCFEPSPACPEPGPLPALAAGRLTLASFGNSAKLTPAVIGLWCQVLKAVPDARLLLHVRGAGEPQVAERMRGRFAQQGVDPARVEPFGRLRFEDYLRLHERADLALDMLTFSGVTTTFYTLWMGVPVVTLPGELPITRGTAAIEHALGLDEFIAASPEEYVEIVVRAAGDLPRLQELRRGLRERMRGSALLDAPAFTRRLEDAYRGMWREWCAAPR